MMVKCPLTYGKLWPTRRVRVPVVVGQPDFIPLSHGVCCPVPNCNVRVAPNKRGDGHVGRMAKHVLACRKAHQDGLVLASVAAAQLARLDSNGAALPHPALAPQEVSFRSAQLAHFWSKLREAPTAAW
jgi:hypothetical protein